MGIKLYMQKHMVIWDKEYIEEYLGIRELQQGYKEEESDEKKTVT